MKSKNDHAWMLDVLRDLAAYASNHELKALSQELMDLRSNNEAILLGTMSPRSATRPIYRRDFSV